MNAEKHSKGPSALSIWLCIGLSVVFGVCSIVTCIAFIKALVFKQAASFVIHGLVTAFLAFVSVFLGKQSNVELFWYSVGVYQKQNTKGDKPNDSN